MTPVSRRELIRRLRALGWDGPEGGGQHAFMRHPSTRQRLRIPNEHGSDIGVGLLKQILGQAGIPGDLWNRL